MEPAEAWAELEPLMIMPHNTHDEHTQGHEALSWMTPLKRRDLLTLMPQTAREEALEALQTLVQKDSSQDRKYKLGDRSLLAGSVLKGAIYLGADLNAGVDGDVKALTNRDKGNRG